MDEERLDIDPDEVERFLAERAAASEKKQRDGRYIGAPLAFVSDVCRLTEGQHALAVALLVYRRTCIEHSRTVTLPSADLARLGINRHRKREALGQLQAAGLIKVRNSVGRTARITLKWR